GDLSRRRVVRHGQQGGYRRDRRDPPGQGRAGRAPVAAARGSSASSPQMIPTIFALASGGGRAALSVYRLSGPAAGEALRALAGDLPAPRLASLRILRDRD